MGVQLKVELDDLKAAGLKTYRVEGRGRCRCWGCEAWHNPELGMDTYCTDEGPYYEWVGVEFPEPIGRRSGYSEYAFLVDNKNINHDVLDYLIDNNIPYQRG